LVLPSANQDGAIVSRRAVLRRLAIAVGRSRKSFEPLSENKLEFTRPMREGEAMLDYQRDDFISPMGARRLNRAFSEAQMRAIVRRIEA
jgi:hypothetical protein